VNLETWAIVGTRAIANANAIHFGLRFAPDGRTVVFSIGPRLYVWDADTGAELREVRDKGPHVQDLTFTPDGRYLFTVSNDTTVKVREIATWEVAKSYTWKAGALRCVEVSPDGTLAAAGSVTGKIVVWDVDV
jgi:WD40 repeat protein